MPITKEQKEKIITMKNNNFSYKQISEEVGVTHNQIKHTWQKEGYPKKINKMSEEDIGIIKNMRPRHTLKEIGLKINKSVSEISLIIKTLNLPKKIKFVKSRDLVKSPKDRVRLKTLPWTEEEVELAKQLKLEKRSHVEIASILKRSLASVRNKFSLIGLHKQDFENWSQDEISKFKQMSENGKNFFEIGKELQKGILSICHKAHNLKIPYNFGDGLIEDEKQIKEYFKYRLKISLRGAKIRNFEYEIDEDYLYQVYLKQNGKCIYTGLPIRLITGDYGVSIDRINSNLGYVKGNVALCIACVNVMKMHYDVKKIISLSHLISERSEKIEETIQIIETMK